MKKSPPTPTCEFDELQAGDRAPLLSQLASFWAQYRAESLAVHVVPRQTRYSLAHVLNERLPKKPSDPTSVFAQAATLLDMYSVRTGNPMFMGYVTPPSAEIGIFGDALAGITNQNVSFATLSPIGTAFESVVVSWLREIIGMGHGGGGILTSGGSEANLYALAVARRWLLGPAFNSKGYTPGKQGLRIYCSEETHHSIDKAAMMLGIGSDNVVRIPVDGEHRIRDDLLISAIESDLESGNYRPLALVGNAGTRMCCAFDDLGKLRTIATNYKIWFHVDAAYGGFLRLASNPPRYLEHLGTADSAIIDPHKLLFVPYDCGALLVQRQADLADCFGGAEGEYIEPTMSEGMVNFANLGVQLGRSMRALKVWLTLKRFGTHALGREFDRLLALAKFLSVKVDASEAFELLGPVDGIALCFRWRGLPIPPDRLNKLNSTVRRMVLESGAAFVDEVWLGGRVGMRVCMTNFRTQPEHLEKLLYEIDRLARGGH